MAKKYPDWVISDTHFGHNNIIKFEPEFRPFKTIEEHDETLVRLWNERVRLTDIVLHLGDVFFGNGFHVLPRLMGRKWLVGGNHDHYNYAQYTQHFERLYGMIVYKEGIVASHAPIHDSVLEFRWKANIHGHTHSRPGPTPRHINLSVEHTNLAPIHWDEVLQRVSAIA